MIKKIIISIILLFTLITPSSLFADDGVGTIAKNWFTNYSRKISLKYSDQKEIVFFENFSERLNILLTQRKFTQPQINLINDLIKLSNEYVFKLKRKEAENSTKTRLNNEELLKDFKHLSYNPEHIFLENGIWYYYKFKNHLKFPEGSNIKKEDLVYNGISTENSVVFLREDNNIGFIVDYEKIKLISDSIIYGIPNKYNFLKEIKDDKKELNYDTDSLFIKLKSDTLDLTTGKTKSQKIKAIYNYILDNIEYPVHYSLTDWKIFSGIDSIKNKNGVCEGYTKAFMYMLNFANIDNVEVIRGYVIDALDFPKIGHAWVKLGNSYYDPTFDDPIGGLATKKYSEYKYYNLPKDLFYTNRYDFQDLPEFLKDKDMDYRKSHIAKNIEKLISKYRYSGYNILKPYLIRIDNGISIDKKLDISDLVKIMGSYEVNNFRFTQDGKTKIITNFNYYILENVTSIDDVLEQINYNLDGYYLFKWNLGNGNYEYRLAYNVIIN